MRYSERLMDCSHAVLNGFRAAFHTRRFLVAASLLVLALVNGSPSSLVDGQSVSSRTGRRMSFTYILNVDTQGRNLNTLCVGQNVSFPVTVRANITTPRGLEVRGYEVRSATTVVTSLNPDIVQAERRLMPWASSNTSIPFNLYLTPVSEGSATIDIRATIETSVHINSVGDDEVGSPFRITRQLFAQVRLRVVPCEYRVDIESTWLTSMHGAETVLIANADNILLSDCNQSDACEFEPPITGTPSLVWTWANNRITGCWASSGQFSSRAPAIRLRRTGNRVEMTITYSRAVPGDGNSPYYRNLCLPHFTVGTALCSERPDGVCWTMPAARPYDWFEPQQPDSSRLRFSLDGGTVSTRHTISHSWGQSNGLMTVTLTPVRRQQ